MTDLQIFNNSEFGAVRALEYDKNGKRITGTQTMVTPKGREALRLMLIGPKKE